MEAKKGLTVVANIIILTPRPSGITGKSILAFSLALL